MRNRGVLEGWTALGASALGVEYAPARPMPAAFEAAIGQGWGLPPAFEPLAGEGVPPRRARYVYRLTWAVLRDRGGYRRPLRLDPDAGLSMLVPFGGRGLGVLPQRPPKRVPGRLRGMALVGRSLAAYRCGVRLLVVTGVRSPELEEVITRGRVAWCTLDRLEEALCSAER
ncbi:MAG: hypothetical protein ACQETZ_04660 [Candidatus Fermentibacterota bacterium]